MKKILLTFLALVLLLTFAVPTLAEDANLTEDQVMPILRLLAESALGDESFSGAPDAEYAMAVLGGYLHEYMEPDQTHYTRDELAALYDGLFAEGAFADAAQGPFVAQDDGYTYMYGDGEALTMVAVNDIRALDDGGTTVDLSVWRDVHGGYDEFRYNAEAVLMADGTAIFGMKAVSFAPSADAAPVFNGATADAVLDEQYGNDYAASNAIDGDMATCWAYTGSDTQPTLRLTAAEPQRVRALAVTAGYAKNEDIFAKNCRVKEVRVTLSDGTEKTFSLDEASVCDGMWVLPLSRVCEADEIRLTVTKVYPGAKYDDVCVSEVRVF